MRRIKALHIITRFSAGGARDIALAIARGLDKNKFDTMLASGPQDFDVEAERKWSVKVAVIADLVRELNPFRDLKALIRLYFFIKKNKFDIVHSHTSKAGVLASIAAKLAGVPIIFYTPHGSIFQPIYYGRRKIFLLSRLENFVSFFIDKIITCSENERKDYLSHKIGSENKYITIYHGIKPDGFLGTYNINSIRKALNISNDTMLVGNIARLVPEKGHIFCLEAFKMIIDKFSNAKLLIAGEGMLRLAIEAKINELNLNDSVIMAGHRNDIAEILSALDIVLFTSIWEGAPIAIIEAMLAGGAIVATKVGGIPELIEDGVTGILIPSGDKAALVKAVITLINDKALAKKIGEAARQYAKERFTLELMIKNTTKLYEGFIDLKMR